MNTPLAPLTEKDKATLYRASTHYTNTNVTNGHTYKYRIKANSSSGNDSGYSYTQEVYYYSPTSLEDESTTTNSIKLKIKYPYTSSVPKYLCYTVVERKNSNGEWEEIGLIDPNMLTFIDSNLDSGESYYYRVHSRIDGEDINKYYPSENGKKFATMLKSPTSLSVSATSNSSVKLTWTDTTDNEEYFKIYRRKDNGDFVSIATLSKNTTEYKNTSLSLGHKYEYKVQTIGGTSKSDYSNTVTVNFIAPTTLKAQNILSRQIKLTWSYPTLGEIELSDLNVVIERKYSGAAWEVIDIISADTTSYNDYSVTPDEVYYYRIKITSDNSDLNLYYPITNTGIYSKTMIEEPTGFYGYAISDTQILFSWDNKYPSSYKYTLEQQAESGLFDIVESDIRGSTYTYTFIKENQEGVFRLRVYSDENVSGYSDEINVKAEVIPNDDYIKVSYAPGNNPRIHIKWEDASDLETKYELWRMADSDNRWFKYMDIEANETAFLDESFDFNDLYYYKVRAVKNDNVFSKFSDTGSCANFLPETADTFSSINYDGKVLLVWAFKCDDADKNIIEYRHSINEEWKEYGLFPTNRFFLYLYDLDETKIYNFRIKNASNKLGTYSYSNEIKVKPGVPLAPSRLNAEIEHNNVKLTWTDSAMNVGNEKFYIYRSENNDEPQFLAKTDPYVTEYIDTTIEYNKQYSYTVKAKNGAGFSDAAFSTSVSIPSPPIFNDLDVVPWAENSISNLVKKGIIQQNSNREFRPKDFITRAEYINMLSLAFKIDNVPAGSLKDVHAGDWFYRAIMKSLSAGIIDYPQDGYFNPNAPLTREDMAYFTGNMLYYKNKNLGAYEATVLYKFNDYNDISPYAKSSFAILCGEEIINGRDNYLAPKEYLTRAEASVVLYLTLQKFAD